MHNILWQTCSTRLNDLHIWTLFYSEILCIAEYMQNIQHIHNNVPNNILTNIRLFEVVWVWLGMTVPCCCLGPALWLWLLGLLGPLSSCAAPLLAPPSSPPALLAAPLVCTSSLCRLMLAAVGLASIFLCSLCCSLICFCMVLLHHGFLLFLGFVEYRCTGRKGTWEPKQP